MDDADRIALEAGLIRLSNDHPGITRRRRGTGFSYVDDDGRVIDDNRRAEIEALAIPPAWTGVWISPEPTSHILATGTDVAGRKQYLYHSEWRSAADAAKFTRLAGFSRGLTALRKRVDHDLRGAIELQDTQAAIVTRMLDDTLIRVGSRAYTDDHDTYGATTLHAEHIDVHGRSVTLQFRAKGGIERTVDADDRLLARRLAELVEGLDAGDPVFHDDEGRPISRRTVNEYISRHMGGDFSAKDFRTWGASCEVAGVLGRLTYDPDTADSAIRAAIEHAAELLGNTPTVCRASYVAPAVTDAYTTGELHEAWRRSRASKWIQRSERTCGRVLVLK
ncbi:MAG: DNA topoisomerase IB [Ilumatobacteraceae bacterium]